MKTNTAGLNQSQLEATPPSFVHVNQPLFREIRALNKSKGRIRNFEGSIQRKPSIKQPKKTKIKRRLSKKLIQGSVALLPENFECNMTRLIEVNNQQNKPGHMAQSQKSPKICKEVD
ncbi:hypothetical protein FGO68_gene6837 [Halteria grandinella]|uniref:Uncharacterized protein n=1 Tax=Halteria grandinella TaxID=5974 RepID=A0A8J8NC44_HALGN|nr:hypothetical protein FGO68_gene331 [Halteria grandinella]TNV71741.1 hypothetical protein FGO68_gene6837 [Halteria grandinella]